MNMRRELYIVLMGQVISGGGTFNIEYSWDGLHFSSRKEAVSHGFKTRGSDDFNIGIVRDRHLVRLDWMDDIVTGDHKEIKRIQDQLNLNEVK